MFLKKSWKIFLIIIFYSCSQPTDVSIKENRPPETSLWVDSIAQVITSTVKLHWVGDDPDGFVKGYFLSVDGINWSWTTSNESTLTLKLGSQTLDTSTIKVKSVDEKNLEDPTPARINLVVKNSPPSVSFNISSEIPQVTLPVATFAFSGKDPDGANTIQNYFIALNDTLQSNWKMLPSNTNLITLVADLADTTKNVVEAKILIGTNLQDSNLKLPNLKLNAGNRLYLYCQDATGAKSKIVNMPDSSKSWFVKKPNGVRKLLLVDEFGIATPDPDLVYKEVLQTVADKNGKTFSDYDIVDLSNSPIPKSIAKFMMLETIKLYKIIFWYGKVINFDLAQQVTPQFNQFGGRALFSTGFSNLSLSGTDPSMLALDFAPIDSLITSYAKDSTTVYGYIPRVYSQSKILPTDSLSENKFPLLVFDRTALFGTYALQAGFSDKVLYRLDSAKATNPNNSEEKWIGKPAVISENQNKKIVFSSVPLHLCNTVDPQTSNSRLKLFLEKIFKDEFGQ